MPETTSKKFRLSFVNAAEDVPRLVRAYGRACDREFALVLRPTEERGVLGLVRKKAGGAVLAVAVLARRDERRAGDAVERDQRCRRRYPREDRAEGGAEARPEHAARPVERDAHLRRRRAPRGARAEAGGLRRAPHRQEVRRGLVLARRACREVVPPSQRRHGQRGDAHQGHRRGDRRGGTTPTTTKRRRPTPSTGRRAPCSRR